jgi:hypothetical protein
MLAMISWHLNLHLDNCFLFWISKQNCSEFWVTGGHNNFLGRSLPILPLPKWRKTFGQTVLAHQVEHNPSCSP